MATNRTLQPKSETILVAGVDSAMATSGVLIPASGNAANIADGQLAAVCVARDATVPYGTFLDAGDVVTDAPVIKLLQGTANSADLTQVGNFAATGVKGWVESHEIDGRNTMSFTGKVAAIDLFNTHVIGDLAANAGAINVLDNQVYELQVGFSGNRHDKYNSTSGKDSIRVAFETPDYTTLGTTDPLDHLVKNVCFEANLNSKAFHMGSHRTFGNKPFVAFAVRSSAGGAGTTLTNISTGVTTSVPFMTHQSLTYNFEFTTAMQETIADVITASSALAGTSTIEVIDRSTAGTAADTDVILLMALDVETALVDDRFKEVKVRLDVGYGEGFNLAQNSALLKEETTQPYEGEGSGRRWKIQAQKLSEHEVWSQQVRPYMNFMITPPSYVDPTLDYSAFIIEHQSFYRGSNEFTDNRYHRTIILIPADAAAGTTSYGTLVTSLNAILSPWLESVNTGGRMERINTPATLPNYFA